MKCKKLSVIIIVWINLVKIKEVYNMVTFSLMCIHLQSIFDWNVKQLFLYLSAEYSTKNNVSMKEIVEVITHFVLH